MIAYAIGPKWRRRRLVAGRRVSLGRPPAHLVTDQELKRSRTGGVVVWRAAACGVGIPGWTPFRGTTWQPANPAEAITCPTCAAGLVTA